MVVVMKETGTEAQIDAVIARLIELGMDVHRSSGATRTVLGVVGAQQIDSQLIGILDGVARGAAHHRAVKAGKRELSPRNHCSLTTGKSGKKDIMAGPCGQNQKKYGKGAP